MWARSTPPSWPLSWQARWIHRHGGSRDHPFGGIDRVFPERGMPLGGAGSTFRGGLLSAALPTTRGEERDPAMTDGSTAVTTAPTDISLVAEPGSGRSERLPRSA